MISCEKSGGYSELYEQITTEVVDTTEEIQTTNSVDVNKELNSKEVSTTENITAGNYNLRKDITIVLDPGHQAPSVDMSAKEPNAPGSSVLKEKSTSGTTGKFTGVGEYELNLTIAKKVYGRLAELGYNVIMTREDNKTAISNMERAMLANEAHANVSVRIHANGSEDSATNGALVLIGSESNPYVNRLYGESYRLGEEILNSYCTYTGMRNLGVQENDNMTGINWSEIPVIILEMGFMSNESDDTKMQEDSFQEKMVEGIVRGIEKYFYMDSDTKMSGLQYGNEELRSLIDNQIKDFYQHEGKVSVCVEDLITGEMVEVGNESMVAASLIKLYIAGCIYEMQEEDSENAPKDVDELVKKMLSHSDNDATNLLVLKIGNGDVATGMERVNAYCSEHGLTDSFMGRLMLDFKSGKENYTSVNDTVAFLCAVYNGSIPGSEKILIYLKQQERINKIPAGIPKDIIVANKTGELDEVENDAAIVFVDNHPYVICVMAGELTDTSYAREWMVGLSKEVYNYFVK